MADQHSDEVVGRGHVTNESFNPTSVTDQHFDEHVSEDHVVGQSLESTGVANQHSDEDVSIADVAIESLKLKGVVDKHSDEGETEAEVAHGEDKHSDKGDRIVEVALESLKSNDDTGKQFDEDETIAEVALVADKHTDKSDRIAEVALESLKSKFVADKRLDEGENADEVALESMKSKGVADILSIEGGSNAEVAFETLKSKGVTDKHPNEGEDKDDIALESMKSQSVTDKLSTEGESIVEVALETLKSNGVADSLSDEGEKMNAIDLESMKSKSVADKHSDEDGSIAEVTLETLKSNDVADKNSDEGALTTNATVKNSDSMETGLTMEINVKTLDSQLHKFIVDKNMPVSIFKEAIASEVGLPVEQQRLIFRGKVLKDDDFLSEYHVESGHTLHLVDRQPSEFQLSSGSSDVETTAWSRNAGQHVNPHVGHVSHSVVLGTIGGVGDQDDISNPDVNQVIGAVLNFIGTGGQGPTDGTGTTQPLMQSQPRSPSQSVPQGYPIPRGAVPPLPTLAMPIPESLHTLSEFMNHMDRALSQNDGTEDFQPVELPSNALGMPSPAALAVVMRHAQRLLSGPAINSLYHAARRLEEEEGSSDVTVRTQIQTEAMQSGLAMQHLGALLLELGRTMLTLRIGQSPVESSVNAGPAVYISSSGPNPIMVQPFPLQTNSLFSGTALNHGTFGPVGIGDIPRHVNIHIHPGPRATNVESNQGEHANINAGVSSQTRGIGDNMRNENQSSFGQVHAVLPEDAEGTGNATSSNTRMKSSSETEGGSSSSGRNIPLGLGPGGLQPKRRQQQTRSEAGSSGISTSHANQSLPSSSGQLDPATVMNQVVQNPALNNLLAGVSNKNGAESPDVFKNLMTQLSQNPEMMNTVNHLAQQVDVNQDLTSMLAGVGGSGGGGGSGRGGGNLDMSSLVQQMMPFVSQALNSGSSTSSSNKLQSVLRRKGMLHRRSSSVKGLNTHERSSDFQMNLENAAQKIVEHYPPLEIFSSVVQTAAALRNNVYDTSAINELSMEEELAQEFTEMLKRDISRRLQ